MKKLLIYTREPIDNVIYDARLAHSMHLALEVDGVFQALNHNSGVLFPLATENENGSLNPKCLKCPRVFALKDGGYGVVAIRTGQDGEDDEESVGSVLFWKTADFVEYEEVGLMKITDKKILRARCNYSEDDQAYEVCWKEEDEQCYLTYVQDPFELKPGKHTTKVSLDSVRAKRPAPEAYAHIEGALPTMEVEITDEVAERLYKKLTCPVNVGMVVPESVRAEELKDIYATALYSDGTTAKKPVVWDMTSVDTTKPGEYMVTGTVKKPHFAFPVAFNRADPCVTKWGEKYYFIATNDADGNHTLYIREADSIEGLAEAEEILLLDSETYEGIGGLLWAPEFHEIDGRLYIFHAATPGEFFWEESHLMSLKEGGNPACREDWSAPRKIEKPDGTPLCEAGKTISLDMTCFQWEGEYYVIWSQREFLPVDLGAWLYIAKLNPEKPWQLLTDPVILSKPDYGWANNHTFVDEGPFALLQDDRLYVTFSSAAVDTSYVVSYLTIEKGKDLLVRGNWRKNNYPILTSRSVDGEYGTGHNAYVIDEDGIVWNTYHARPGTEGVRSSGIRRVHFDIDNAPVLDMTEDRDVSPEYLQVTTKVIVE